MKVSKFVYTITALLSLSLTACKKWLDTPNPLQVDQKALFSNEQGFKDVLNGVYLQMGSQSMYGRDMSYGLLSVLGRNYDTTMTSSIDGLYYQGAQYYFQDPKVSAVARSIWEQSYKSIANINNLLANLDSHKSVFAGYDYYTIKGEALGLRAFLHFELLRLFAPSPAAAGLSASAIPYMTTFSANAVPTSTTGNVLDACINDLKISESLLSESDLNTSHFTIWATRGLLARLYLYKGDMTNASLYAKLLINSNKFPLNTSGNSDIMFPKEHLFSLYTFQNNVGTLYKTVFTTSSPLGFSPTNQTALFTTGSGAGFNDYRKSFLDPVTLNVSATGIVPRKFFTNTAFPNTSTTTTPLIRVSEMYYIASECAGAINDMQNATDLLDSVRAHRGTTPKDLTSTISSDSLTIEIKKEYQKEFLGEGQMFFYYKRKNTPFASLPYTKVPVNANASYVFTKPE